MHQPNLVWTSWELTDGGLSADDPSRQATADFVFLDLRFANNGDAPAPLFTVSLMLDGAEVRSVEVENVKPRAHVRLSDLDPSFHLELAKPGPYHLDVVLDSRGDLTETDSADNTLRIDFTKRFLLRDGGPLSAASASIADPGPDMIRVAVEPGALHDDEVEFVLHTPSWLNWRKELVFLDNAMVTSTLSTQDGKRLDLLRLPTSRLEGGVLKFRKAGFLGAMADGIGTLPLGPCLPGSRVRVFWLNDGSHAAAEPIAINGYSSRNLLTQNGTFNTGAGLAAVSVEPGAVPGDQVEFVLVGPGTWHKEIQICESPAAGTGVWPIVTRDHAHEARNGLYTYQLPGSFLLLRAAKMFGIVTDLCIIDAGEAIPGSRITFTWTG